MLLTATRACSLVSTPLKMTPCKPISRACRSEEHTSELQSQSNLVCRLLLEKKKKTPLSPHYHPPNLIISSQTHRPRAAHVHFSRVNHLPTDYSLLRTASARVRHDCRRL